MEALKRLLDEEDALLPGENERKSKLRTLLSQVGRLMKSNFVDTTNKKRNCLPFLSRNCLPFLSQHLLRSDNECVRL
jgi:hypothetical protein